jgi:hypothetical protein
VVYSGLIYGAAGNENRVLADLGDRARVYICGRRLYLLGQAIIWIAYIRKIAKGDM